MDTKAIIRSKSHEDKTEVERIARTLAEQEKWAKPQTGYNTGLGLSDKQLAAYKALVLKSMKKHRRADGTDKREQLTPENVRSSDEMTSRSGSKREQKGSGSSMGIG